MKPTSAAPWALLLAMVWPLQAHALFGDDEARKAIIELRQKVDANKQAADSAAAEAREGDAGMRRSLLELSNQIEQLRAELARLRGQNEQLAREVSELQRQQKDVQAGIDERLRQVEPLRIEFDGQTFTAAPAEKNDFEAAMAQLRKSEFQPAAAAYASFLQRYPASGYTPSVLYWLGNAQYANRVYKEAVATHSRLVREFPAHMRTPEAMLAMANSHVELKDARTAKSTLENLVKAHPNSEAAAAARERLARLR
ncbi:tol-pal system protein YbgF [Hydrogenophaga sp.]|uniref:tol-pal system protein YbgF n=1 Tax=Hydrogenophaga sp. TaxID=1904254 RepID=UPI0027300B08|nr:tol-pal system protein YbgF [Hydrogenophaga sp.]MDP2074291.1 tol-pal system protein YbgF [Hydrogenophaga sp.]MDP3108380.1 tol-pal system protein YbgF [Hydrogenophaga sp.]MDP3348942.1 tol-pal system protein YbgF [Hydrogenophaga sp.]MDZ4283409.1 tol-pal system protein YbgF [Hydrogenophaga sp.]MDZ4398085.1 tol-pal system protein YbgF [Hydrogenophaga sp.]